MRYRQLPLALLGLLLALFIAWFSWLAVTRHMMFRSGAMDLGYTTQVLWNTLHGRPFIFTTYQNAPIDLPLDQFARTDHLFAYHVELLLAPISLLYLIWADPILLLVLQAIGVALGAIPAYLLARRRLASDWAGLAFAGVWLMAPALQGAILSDFHAVTLTASLLMAGLWFLEQRRWALFTVCAALALLAKEDIPLLITFLGVYVALRRGARMGGAVVAAVGFGWFLIATQIIQPNYHGLDHSPFLARLAIFGPTPADTARNALSDPGLVVRWLHQPEIRTYLGGLLASAGGLSLFSPLLLGIASPVIAVNTFSKWAWTYSEGAHYSASVMPFVIGSAIYGTGWLAGRLARWTRRSRGAVTNGLLVWMLLVAGYHSWQIGMGPFARNYHLPRVTEHDRHGRELARRIPVTAAVSAQSNLYPHVAHREKAYLFPAIEDAEYIFLDVTGSAYPIDVAGLNSTLRSLLDSWRFIPEAAEDGYVLLRRGEVEGDGIEDWERFLSFARADAEEIGHQTQATFGDTLELVGYDYAVHNVVTTGQPPATITTYWRALKPIGQNLDFAFFFTREDGAIVGGYSGANPTTEWLPTSTWEVGDIMRIQTPELQVGRDRGVLIAVTHAQQDPTDANSRLPITAANEPGRVLPGGTLFQLFRGSVCRTVSRGLTIAYNTTLLPSCQLRIVGSMFLGTSRIQLYNTQ